MNSEWEKTLLTLVNSSYARRVGSSKVITEYLNARSKQEINRVFAELVPGSPLRYLFYPTKAQKIRAIIKVVNSYPRLIK